MVTLIAGVWIVREGLRTERLAPSAPWRELKPPEADDVVAQGVDYGSPYNLAVTSEYVYFTGNTRTKLLRWKR